MPERAIKIRVLLSIEPMFCQDPIASEAIMRNPAMKIERIVVAKVESIFFSPIFPKIETNAALNADRRAKSIHVGIVLF